MRFLEDWLRQREAGKLIARRLIPGLMAAYARNDQAGASTLLREMREQTVKAKIFGPQWLMYLFNEALKMAVALARELAEVRGLDVEELFTRLAADELARP